MKNIFSVFLFSIFTPLIFCDNLKLAENPGMRLSISNKAFQMIEEHLLPTYINGIPFPLSNFTFAQKVDFIGNIVLNITENHMTFDGLAKEGVQVRFSEPNLAMVSVKNVSAFVDFKYLFNSGFYSSSGTGNMTLSELNFTMTNNLISIPNKHDPSKIGPGIEITDLKIESFKLEIKFSNQGNLEKIIQNFVYNLQVALKIMFEKDLMKVLAPQLNNIMKSYLENITLTQEIIKGKIAIDFSLEENPRVSGDYIQISFNSTISGPGIKDTYVGIPKKIDDIIGSTDLLNARINEYVFNSLFFTLHKEGYIKGMLYSEALGLTTTYFAPAVPSLITTYGIGKPIDLACVSNKEPSLTFTENIITADIFLDIAVIVRADSTKNETAFITDTSIHSNVNFSISDGKISAELKTIEIKDIKIKESKVSVDPQTIKSTFDLVAPAFKGIINAGIKKALDKIVIPDFIKPFFNTSKIVSKNGYLEFINNLAPQGVVIDNNYKLKFLEN